MFAQACGREGAAGVRGDAAESEALHRSGVRARSPRLRRSPPPKTLALTLTLTRLLLYGPLNPSPSPTPTRLLLYRGRDLSKPLLLALKGRVLDVSAGSEYYGPEGPYQLMAGKDASYAFAMMSLKAEDAHANLAGAPARSHALLGTCVARAWHGLGAGLARALRGHGAGVARAGHGLGTGLAVAEPGSCWARAPPWGRMAALGGPRPLPRVEPLRKPPRKPDHGQTGKAGAGGLIWHRAN